MDVRVVKSDDLHPQTSDPVLPVLQVHPAVRFELVNKLPGAPTDRPARVAATRNEVPKGIEWTWRIQIVGSEDEERGQSSSNRPERLDDVLDGLGFSDDIARDHNDVGSGQRSQETSQPLVPIDHVEIRQMQNGESIRSLRG